MIRKIIHTLFFLTLLIAGESCGDEKLNDSIFDTSTPNRNKFEKWNYTHFVQPYNIELKYRLEQIETDINFTLVPAEESKAQKMAQIIKFAWMDAYNEVAKSGFLRENAPKIIHFVGSPAYNPDGSTTIGSADNGLKVTLYNVNGLKDPIDSEQVNTIYLHTMHHEFAHVLHKKKGYDPEFRKVSNGKYIQAQWMNPPYNSQSYAIGKGFVTAYAMSIPDEDFAETFAIYLAYPDAKWTKLLNNAGEEGATSILKKLEIVRSYLKTKWSIDIDKLKDAVQSQSDKLKTYEFEDLS